MTETLNTQANAILVVDDMPANALLLVRMLTEPEDTGAHLQQLLPVWREGNPQDRMAGLPWLGDGRRSGS